MESKEVNMYSKYNVYLKDFPKQDFTTIFNLRTQKVVCFSNCYLFPEPNKLIEKSLIEKGICCLDEAEEFLEVIKKYNDTIYSNNELVIVMLLTGHCNCRCIYCYESELDMEYNQCCNLKKVNKFIYKKMTENQIEKLRVIFYGGEPLLNKKTITVVSEELKKQYGERYKFSIVTNGTLLDERDVKKWIDLGLSKIKVTLDGNAKSHNTRRPFKNGEGTYNIILQNLEKIDKRVEVVINIVIDEKIFGVSEMIKDLKDRGIDISFSLNFKEPTNMTSKEKKDCMLKVSSVLKKEKVTFQTNIKAKHGIICPMKRQNYFVIDGKGQLSGCESILNNSLGNIDSPYNKKIYDLSNKCKKCMYLPICYGGCVYENTCLSEYFEQLLPELLKLYIETDK